MEEPDGDDVCPGRERSTMSTTTLEGRVALVTGASQGIGRHLCAGLLRQGAAVAGTARTPDRLAATLDELGRETGGRTLAVAADVTRREEMAEAVDRVERTLGPLDLVVNGAGLVDPAEVSAWEADPQAWWEVVTSHVLGGHVVASSVLPGMLTRGSGRLVTLGSGMGMRPEPDYSAYSVAKAAQTRLTECLDASLAGTGVYAFTIAPGLVRTPMTEGMPRWEGHTAWTPPERVVELVCSVAAGELDQWAGRFLRAGGDVPSVVAGLAPSGPDRRLGLRPYGPDDPMA